MTSDEVAEAKNLHIFSVDSDKEIQDMWDEIREDSKFHIAATDSDLGVPAPTLDKSSERQNIEGPLYPATGSRNNNRPSDREFEDHRAHHFNATNPVLLCAQHNSHAVLGGRSRIEVDGDASALKKSDDLFNNHLATQSHRQQEEFLTSNLTLEGRRQAQLAGEKFRARGLYYRPRKSSKGLADRQIYHNRWAMYNPAEKPEDVRAGLTPDAKRQVIYALNQVELLC